MGKTNPCIKFKCTYRYPACSMNCCQFERWKKEEDLKKEIIRIAKKKEDGFTSRKLSYLGRAKGQR